MQMIGIPCEGIPADWVVLGRLPRGGNSGGGEIIDGDNRANDAHKGEQRLDVGRVGGGMDPG